MTGYSAHVVLSNEKWVEILMNLYNQNNRNISGKPSSSLNNWDNLMYPISRKKRTNSNTQNGANNSDITAIAGNWIDAIGTIISAIGSTPSSVFTNQTLTDLNIIGNILQAGGSAILSETEDALLDIVGDQISAIGNIAVVAGILSNNEQSGQLLEQQGNLLQVLGAGMTIDTEGNLTLLQTIANTGNIIQVIGNVIQVLANDETLEGEIVGAVGAWIQAVGAVITALASD